MAQHRKTRWLLAPIAFSAFVATWGGWVGLAGLTGFGEVNLLPGIVEPDAGGAPSWSSVDLAIALPLGVEAYAAYALSVWLGAGYSRRARRFAAVSAVFSLLVAAAGQVSYHVLRAGGVTAAPDWLTAFVACIPVVVIGMAATLHHLTGDAAETSQETRAETTLGRLRDAATKAAVRRLDRLAETPPVVSAGTVAETPVSAETLVPVISASQPGPSQVVSETTVSAGQTVSRPGREELLGMVAGLRAETPPVSYAQIGERLGISKAEAGRLGRAVELRARVVSAEPFPVPAAPGSVRLNGHPVLEDVTA